jgi:hypothetical protein
MPDYPSPAHAPETAPGAQGSFLPPPLSRPHRQSRPYSPPDSRPQRRIQGQGLSVRQAAEMLGLPRATLQRRLQEAHQEQPEQPVEAGPVPADQDPVRLLTERLQQPRAAAGPAFRSEIRGARSFWNARRNRVPRRYPVSATRHRIGAWSDDRCSPSAPRVPGPEAFWV